jgi:hypothetical protein
MVSNLLIGNWRTDYNEARPHASGGRIPPGPISRAASPQLQANQWLLIQFDISVTVPEIPLFAFQTGHVVRRLRPEDELGGRVRVYET